MIWTSFFGISELNPYNVQCDFGDGHCDSDDQCLGTLICGTKNCIGNNFDPNKGCCTEPNMDV